MLVVNNGSIIIMINNCWLYYTWFYYVCTWLYLSYTTEMFVNDKCFPKYLAGLTNMPVSTKKPNLKIKYQMGPHTNLITVGDSNVSF